MLYRSGEATDHWKTHLPEREGFSRGAAVAAEERQGVEAPPVPERLLHILQPHLHIHPFDSAGCSNSYLLPI